MLVWLHDVWTKPDKFGQIIDMSLEPDLNLALFSPSPSWLWVSISDSFRLSMEAELDECVDSHSSFSDSVISPSSGSLFPSESSLREELFFFFRFLDLAFFVFFFALLLLSSQCEAFFCFFLFDEDLSHSSLCLEESFLCEATSGLGDRRFSRFLVVCCSTKSVSSSLVLTSSVTRSCHQTIKDMITTAADVHWQQDRWLCRSLIPCLIWLSCLLKWSHFSLYSFHFIFNSL